MKNKLKDIEIGVGIGELKFGMTPEMVIDILGEPDEKVTENFSEVDPDFYSEEWHYDDIELSLSFDMLEQMELGTISVSSEHYLLEGKSLIGLTRKKVEALLDEMDLSSTWEEFKDVEAGGNLLANEDEGLSLWFEDGILIEIQWEIL